MTTIFETTRLQKMFVLFCITLLTIVSNAQHLPSKQPSTPSPNDPIADPKFPVVNIVGGRSVSYSGYAYPACTDNIILNTTSVPNTIAKCGDDTTCTVYCFDKDNRYESRYNCGGSETSGNVIIMACFFSLFLGLCCGGGSMFCYYRKKYGSPYSGYIEINA